jgi:hypothetical protein
MSELLLSISCFRFASYWRGSSAAHQGPRALCFRLLRLRIHVDEVLRALPHRFAPLQIVEVSLVSVLATNSSRGAPGIQIRSKCKLGHSNRFESRASKTHKQAFVAPLNSDCFCRVGSFTQHPSHCKFQQWVVVGRGLGLWQEG